MEFEIAPLQCDKVRMGTALDDSALLKEQDLVCVHNADQTMRDDDGGNGAAMTHQRRANPDLSFCINCSGSVIEYANRGPD